jgi:hypothetical protein
MRIQRICQCCRRTFECVAQNSAKLCGACLIAAALVAPHDLPHNHNDPVIHWVRSPVVASSTSASAGTTSFSWHIPKRGDKPG